MVKFLIYYYQIFYILSNKLLFIKNYFFSQIKIILNFYYFYKYLLLLFIIKILIHLPFKNKKVNNLLILNLLNIYSKNISFLILL